MDLVTDKIAQVERIASELAKEAESSAATSLDKFFSEGICVLPRSEQRAAIEGAEKRVASLITSQLTLEGHRVICTYDHESYAFKVTAELTPAAGAFTKLKKNRDKSFDDLIDFVEGQVLGVIEDGAKLYQPHRFCCITDVVAFNARRDELISTVMDRINVDAPHEDYFVLSVAAADDSAIEFMLTANPK